jgi:hypothetical protein
MSENKNSQYDSGLIVKEVHDFYGQYIRVRDTNSLNSQHFTHFSATYDVNNNPTQVIYYRGVTSHVTNIGCVADSASSLNNKYFSIRACPSNQKYHVWFNVGGAGVAPVVADSIGIEISLSVNDPAVVVATAIRLTINLLYSKIFTVTQLNATLEIRTVGFGVCSNTVDINTGFAITNTAGTQVVTDTVNLTYSGNDPIYNGQVLKNYKYDIWNGGFVFNASASSDSEGLAPASFDKVIVDRDISDDPISYKFYLSTSLVGQIDVTYNTNKSAIQYKKIAI